jgi:hypothetical protein
MLPMPEDRHCARCLPAPRHGRVRQPACAHPAVAGAHGLGSAAESVSVERARLFGGATRRVLSRHRCLPLVLRWPRHLRPHWNSIPSSVQPG